MKLLTEVTDIELGAILIASCVYSTFLHREAAAQKAADIAVAFTTGVALTFVAKAGLAVGSMFCPRPSTPSTPSTRAGFR